VPDLADSSGKRRRHRLEEAHVYLIVEARPHGRGAAELVREALRGGTDVVQLRDKAASDEDVVRAGAALREICDELGGLLIVNDSPELAVACGADGVHLGQDDLAVDRARPIVGADMLIGVSTHSPEQIAAAAASPADYLGVGPVYATPTKPLAAPVGESLVRHAAKYAGKPFFAIGGIDPANAPAVVAAGARRVAVVRAIRDAADPRAAAEALRAALELEEHAGAAR
jgi:thiamine-phosphate pyrophosphorylase